MEFHSCPRSHTRESRVATGSVLCVPCTRQVERHLRALPSLHHECLHHMSSTSKKMNNPTKVSGSRKQDHLKISVLDTRHNILAVLESWSGIITEELATVTPTRSVPHLVRFLIRNLEWLAAQPPAVDFADEIASLHTQLLRTIDPEPSDLHALTRECIVENCTGTINASPKNIGNTKKSSISCSSGHSWEMREWLTLRQLMNQKRKDAA